RHTSLAAQGWPRGCTSLRPTTGDCRLLSHAEARRRQDSILVCALIVLRVGGEMPWRKERHDSILIGVSSGSSKRKANEPAGSRGGPWRLGVAVPNDLPKVPRVTFSPSRPRASAWLCHSSWSFVALRG